MDNWKRPFSEKKSGFAGWKVTFSLTVQTFFSNSRPVDDLWLEVLLRNATTQQRNNVTTQLMAI